LPTASHNQPAGRPSGARCGVELTGLGQANLVLFMSLGSSLDNWAQAGTLARETALYRALAPRLGGVHLVTYGPNDRALEPGLGGLKVRDNRLGLPLALYRRWLALGWGLRDLRPGVVKTNQMQGADVALAAARGAGLAFLARCGYLPSNIAIWRHGQGSPQAAEFLRLEAQVFTAADRVAVTTPAMAQAVTERYGADPARVRVVPNFVDTEIFAPVGQGGPGREDDLLVYVGRLHEEKNLLALIEALKGLPCRLELAGEGPQRDELIRAAQDLGVAASFLGKVDNTDLPRLLARAGAFVLPSKGEHHPKSLLEAMSCGTACLGTDVPGIAELIEHGRTGWLCPTDAAGLRAGIQAVMGDQRLRADLGAAARDFVLANFTFQRVLDLELALLAELVG
jgi:glycosyltransferase involved in cell wall biosynthesis